MTRVANPSPPASAVHEDAGRAGPRGRPGPRRAGLLRNFLSLATANVVSQFLTFGAIVYLARVLGVASFGEVSFAQAFVLYFKLISDAGLEVLGTKRVALEPHRAAAHAGTVLSFRIVHTFAAWALLLVVVALIDWPGRTRGLILLYGLSLLPSALLMEWVFNGLERMGYTAASKLLTSIVYVALAVVIVRGPEQELLVPVCYATGLAAAAVFLIVAVHRRCGPLRLRGDWRSWRNWISEAIPMGLSLVMIQVYYTFDAVMLGFIRGEREVGLYTAPYKIVMFLIGFAGVFGLSIYPRLAHHWSASRDSFVGLMRAASRVTILASLPVALGGTLVAPALVRLFFGAAYDEGVTAFRIVLWSVLTVSTNVPFAYALLACNRQKQYMVSVGGGAAVNVLLNFALIPPYGLLGAAVSTMTAELTVATLLYLFARPLAAVPVAGTLAAGAKGCLVMAAALLLLRTGNVFADIALGAAAYVSGLAVTGGVTRQDLRLAVQTIRGGTQ